MYVADTHAFLWFLTEDKILTEDKKLGKKAKEIFGACDKGEAIIAIP